MAKCNNEIRWERISLLCVAMGRQLRGERRKVCCVPFEQAKRIEPSECVGHSLATNLADRAWCCVRAAGRRVRVRQLVQGTRAGPFVCLSASGAKLRAVAGAHAQS